MRCLGSKWVLCLCNALLGVGDYYSSSAGFLGDSLLNRAELLSLALFIYISHFFIILHSQGHLSNCVKTSFSILSETWVTLIVKKNEDNTLQHKRGESA